MKLYKQYQYDTLENNLPDDEEQILTAIVFLLKTLSHKLLHSIFDNALDKRNFPVLEADTLYAIKLNPNNVNAGWAFIFANKEDEKGIRYREITIPIHFDLIEYMVAEEIDCGGVVHGFKFQPSDIVNTNKILSAVEKYINTLISRHIGS